MHEDPMDEDARRELDEATLNVEGRRLWSRGWTLRCPACGEGRPFEGLFRVRERCPHCSYGFARESGYFLGSIYLNYGLTGLFILVWVGVAFFLGLPLWTQTIVPLLFALVFPIWFLRYARSLWMAIDLAIDPPRGIEFRRPGR